MELILTSVSSAVAAMWTWIDQWGVALTASATIATAAFAAFALVRAGQESNDRSRPYVLAELRHAEHSDTALDLVIRNAGASMARDVRVSFDPPLTVPPGFGPNVTTHVINRYSQPLPCLAPGQELHNVWWSGRDKGGGKLENAEPTPEVVTIRTAYKGGRGRRQYTDSFPLDTRVMLAETYSTSSTSIKGRLKTMDASLKSASGALADIARAATRRDRAPDSDHNSPEMVAKRARLVEQLLPSKTSNEPTDIDAATPTAGG